MRAFVLSVSLLLHAGAATAVPTVDPAQVEQHQALAEVMDAAMAQLTRPGPKQEGWDRGGIDIRTLIEAAPGGSRNNYLLEVDKDGDRGVTIFSGGDPARLVPAGWSIILHSGPSKKPQEADTLTFFHLDGPYFVTGWESRRRVGDAFCSGQMGGYLYNSADQSKKGEIPTELVPMVFQGMVARFEKQPICWRYDRDGDGFRMSHFLEDGRTLPALNEMGSKLTIVRAGPIEELLAKPAK